MWNIVQMIIDRRMNEEKCGILFRSQLIGENKWVEMWNIFQLIIDRREKMGRNVE
jgi:hypothetical protein